MFELQIVDPVPGLERLGDQVQLRELCYGDLRRAMSEANGVGRAGEALLARSLWVDGAPIGLEALDALPGRFAGAIARAMERCLMLHGMGPPAAPDESAANDEDGDAPGEASTPGEA